ncbi:5-oxoprolinase subunit PxpB [Paralcaligenes sp. KSB-10]|uniref:5-oxoprolinase subunit PxpB n=1 Tax=Paralcaligenes sp. KSB-10 TaxID=2901142 RepID=UPI001E5D1223|nr:5-oxoprolinase subunit PxpB [Paralcaligenes sp. KSB-10]UHL62848.1 5-oxoprolinase subunit PxpB [Paralcaligenes sp. KSB-10]
MPPSAENTSPAWKIVPQGDRTLLLIFGTQIDVETGQRCIAAAAALRAAGIKGIGDIVPTFNTVAVHYHPLAFEANTKFRHLAIEIEKLLGKALAGGPQAYTARQIDIPVCYGGQYGPDLADVATHCGLSEAEVIRLHSETPAYVFMLGFAPGAPYLGIHDARLAIGRRNTPRTAVPAGSVAMANRQTIIYPNQYPGGWHLIGTTPVVLFNPQHESPSLLAPGDTVRFVPVSEAEFKALQESQA